MIQEKTTEHHKEECIHELVEFKKILKDDYDYYCKHINQMIVNIDRCDSIKEMMDILIIDLANMMDERENRLKAKTKRFSDGKDKI